MRAVRGRQELQRSFETAAMAVPGGDYGFDAPSAYDTLLESLPHLLEFVSSGVQRMKRNLAIGCFALVGVALLFAAVLAYRSRGESTWKELRTVAELRQQFNRDQGSIRIVLLLSPT